MRSSSRPSSRRSHHNQANFSTEPVIDKLDYHPGGKPLIPHERHGDRSRSRHSEERSYAGSFFEEVAEGIVDRDRERMKKEVIRYGSFAWAIVNCLGAGSITAYSVYGRLFQERLHYNQLQVNGISITAELAMYLPVPLWGYLCDRYGPARSSLLAGIFFGVGYVLAAFTYHSGALPSAGGDGWPYWVMVLAFIPIGFGTSCMYLSAVTTCAKNFGRGNHKGLALALPIAAFGLSGMWLAQVGSNLLYERGPEGEKGDVDVYRFFLFLGFFLLAIGLIGFGTLRIVGEDELIEEAIEELEQSGLLEDSEFFQPAAASTNGYGTVPTENGTSSDDVNNMRRSKLDQKAQTLEEQRKTWLLNEETRRFVSDPTMWWLSAGFFLVTGPGEAFINNLGTIIGTLYPPGSTIQQTSAATHVSIVALTSTIARILTGTLTDLLAPTTSPHQHRRGPSSLANSIVSLPNSLPSTTASTRLQISRVVFLITFCLLMSAGQIILATGVVQNRGDLFWIVSACIGSGYGAAFSLTPIIVSVIWGVENFGTNWGICAVVPAFGATVWGLVYSGVYQWAAERRVMHLGEGTSDRLCYGTLCYAPTFWAMAGCVWVACGLWVWAWKGPDGWARRGIAV